MKHELSLRFVRHSAKKRNYLSMKRSIAVCIIYMKSVYNNEKVNENEFRRYIGTYVLNAYLAVHL